MFDRIAPRYDLLNRLLSFRQDVRWRNKVTEFLRPDSGQHILDLATGTGDQLLALFSKNTRVQTAVGIDMAEKMLEKGREKIQAKNLSDRITLRLGDATAIPCENHQFDAVTLSFGIRNIPNVGQALKEIYRVLKPQGRALILEFSLPENPMIRPLYLFYLRHLLPKIGLRISGDPQAYRYLNQTIETFPYGPAFCNILSKAGFVSVERHPLTLGVATIYQGDKPIVHANA
jgi:demethylmenaquinone methyltransferase/2-methoxy-6-polyprenyl-1,4-benzoquinol methylase